MTAKTARPLALGITGGVASGKSTVASFLAARGASLVSADQIARDLLTSGSETTCAVLERFGSEYGLDEGQTQIDRKKLARRIFSDDAARVALGEIMHPKIRRVMLAEIAAAKQDAACRLIAAEIPLLYESHLESLVDEILVASCSEETQLERLQARQPWLTFDDAVKQIKSQIALVKKVELADFVIDTDRTLESVRADVDAVFDRLAVQ